MSELVALAAKVEGAAEGSRELDEEMACALGWQPSDKLRGDSWWHHRGTDVWMNALPRFTASIDAALTLVPEGEDWFVAKHHKGPGYASAVGGKTQKTCSAATPALALCAATLRARGRPAGRGRGAVSDFTDDEKAEIKNFAGYPTSLPAGYQTWRFYQVAGLLDFRLNNFSQAETAVVRRYLITLKALDGVAEGERTALFMSWRRRLCGFLGIQPGPELSEEAGP